MDVSLPTLDGEIERAVAEVAAAWGQVGAEAAPALGAYRRVSSRTTYVELGERGQDPLASAAQEWVYTLTLERVLWPDSLRLAAGWREPTLEVTDPPPARLSPRDARDRLLRERDDARRRVMAGAFAESAGSLADAARILAERRAQAAAQLDAPFGERLELPADPPEAIAAAASALLDETAEMALRAGHWADAIGAALARDATGGWPARLGPRWLEDVFRGTGLTDGLDMRLGPLPEPLGATSFARALGALGRATCAAGAPRSAPFSLAHPPFDVRASRRSALFASLALDPVFARRVLGLGRIAAREQATRVARGLLVSVRLDAARVLLRGALLLPARERPERFEEVTSRALGAPIPPSLAGLVPALSPHDPTRFAGLLLAASDRRSMVERFDEDWFANPAAARALREEDGVLPASRRVQADALQAGRAILVADATALLA